MPILIDSAELAGLAIEGPLYGTSHPRLRLLRAHANPALFFLSTGIFLSLFIICAYDLLRRRATNETQISWPMVVAGVSLILLATARFVVDVTYIFIAFIHNDPRTARLAFLQDVTPHIFIAKHALFITSLFIGDLFVVRLCPYESQRGIDSSRTELQVLGRLGKEHVGSGPPCRTVYPRCR